MNKISSVESSRLVVTYRPVGELIPDPRNARLRDENEHATRGRYKEIGKTSP